MDAEERNGNVHESRGGGGGGVSRMFSRDIIY